MSKQTISVFGLGSMGFGVACSALAAGHHVYGFDVNIASQDRILAKGGDRAEIAEAGAVSDVVVSVVLNGAQTTDILFGETGIVPHMRPGSVVFPAPQLRLIWRANWRRNAMRFRCCILMPPFRAGRSRRPRAR